jgi:hypothetical protein
MSISRDEREALDASWRWFFAIIGMLVVAGAIGLIYNIAHNAVVETAQVVDNEVGPQALLDKYRYFKRMAAAIEARQADIEIMQKRADDTRQTYGSDASKWPRDVRESHAQDRDSAMALKLSFNKMAAEYNTAMSDRFKAFLNVGDMPKGWPENEKIPLKREYATYKVE